LHLTTPCQQIQSLAILCVKLATGVTTCIDYNEGRGKKIALHFTNYLIRIMMFLISNITQERKIIAESNGALHRTIYLLLFSIKLDHLGVGLGV